MSGPHRARRARGADWSAAGQAGRDARAALRPFRPSLADAPAFASRRRRDGPADRALAITPRSRPRRFDDFYEPVADISHTLYASPAIRPRTKRCGSTPARRCSMRAPGEASGSIALESAIDEMAAATGIDPLQFRLLNYAETEPISGKPFSSKALRECFAAGRRKRSVGKAAAAAAPDARRRRTARRLGRRRRDLSRACMFQGAARAILRGDGTGVCRDDARTTWDKAR